MNKYVVLMDHGDDEYEFVSTYGARNVAVDAAKDMARDSPEVPLVVALLTVKIEVKPTVTEVADL